MISAGENGQQPRPPSRLRAEPRGSRITENLRRIERREIRPVHVVRVLERGPRGVDDESAEDRENDEWLKPPSVAPLRFTEAAVKERERCGHRLGVGGRKARIMDCPSLRASMAQTAFCRQALGTKTDSRPPATRHIRRSSPARTAGRKALRTPRARTPPNDHAPAPPSKDSAFPMARRRSATAPPRRAVPARGLGNDRRRIVAHRNGVDHAHARKVRRRGAPASRNRVRRNANLDPHRVLVRRKLDDLLDDRRFANRCDHRLVETGHERRTDRFDVRDRLPLGRRKPVHARDDRRSQLGRCIGARAAGGCASAPGRRTRGRERAPERRRPWPPRSR